MQPPRRRRLRGPAFFSSPASHRSNRGCSWIAGVGYRVLTASVRPPSCCGLELSQAQELPPSARVVLERGSRRSTRRPRPRQHPRSRTRPRSEGLRPSRHQRSKAQRPTSASALRDPPRRADSPDQRPLVQGRERERQRNARAERTSSRRCESLSLACRALLRWVSNSRARATPCALTLRSSRSR